MPIFTNPISSQNTATSAGVQTFPWLGQLRKGSIMMEFFNRGTLNPTNAVPFYSTGGVGTPIVGINSTVNGLLLSTSNANNDNAYFVTDAFYFSRNTLFIENRSQISLDIIIGQQNTTNLKFFFGIVDSNWGKTALPTTTSHMGIYVDTSVSNNIKLSSADGTTQTTVDSSSAISTLTYRLNMIWNSNSGGTINLYDSTYTNLISSKTVSSFVPSTNSSMKLGGFVQTLATVPKQAGIYELIISCT